VILVKVTTAATLCDRSVSGLSCVRQSGMCRFNLTALVRVDGNKARLRVIAQNFENGWLGLFRYLRPVRCLHDQGNAFVGAAFQYLLDLWGIEAHSISVQHNPQANSVCERSPQTFGHFYHRRRSKSSLIQTRFIHSFVF
jgi:hypothetical protein